ncbi:hypothetical protein [Pedobacter metabolipauper]|uniref:Lipoprotein n=1 Tax=Pedobacter metabolipauper TaxID=425513 RepID=A0A4R6SWY4_9SPHI|nr:hypothetical protein [Pedobacter metabolipauper]TDQ11014.1 hypothetical protein ATK78_0128 [Pedobacter metabolipauper]
MIRKITLSILLITTFYALTGCKSGINKAFKSIQQSNERSNQILIDSNKTLLTSIKQLNNKIFVNQADSINNANYGLNVLVDTYKKDISNLALVHKDEDVAYEVVATPDLLKGVLISASMEVNKQVSKISLKVKNASLDSLLTELHLVSMDEDYFEKTFKNVPSANALAILSSLQVKSSDASNTALHLILSLSNENPSIDVLPVRK